MIDSEVQWIVTDQYEQAQLLLQDQRAALEILTEQLLKQETVDGGALKQALESDQRVPARNGQVGNGLFVSAVVN